MSHGTRGGWPCLRHDGHAGACRTHPCPPYSPGKVAKMLPQIKIGKSDKGLLGRVDDYGTPGVDVRFLAWTPTLSEDAKLVERNTLLRFQAYAIGGARQGNLPERFWAMYGPQILEELLSLGWRDVDNDGLPSFGTPGCYMVSLTEAAAVSSTVTTPNRLVGLSAPSATKRMKEFTTAMTVPYFSDHTLMRTLT